MQRFFTVLILTCLMLTFFVSHAAHSDLEDDDLAIAERNEITYKDRGDTAYDAVRNANFLYLLAKAEYDKNAAKIERGVAVTASKLMAATVSMYVTGGLTAPVAVGVLVDALGLAGDIHASASLLDAFEAAISHKQSAITSFESAKTTYNTKYDALIEVLATHLGWTKSNVYSYISDDENRDSGLIHKNSPSRGKNGWWEKRHGTIMINPFPSILAKVSVQIRSSHQHLRKHRIAQNVVLLKVFLS